MALPALQLIKALQAALEARRSSYLADLEHLVGIDSGSYSKAGVDWVGAWMVERFEALGGSVELHPSADLGNTIVARFEGREPGPGILLIGHADTVFEDGTAAARPFEIRGGRLHGPGVSDMKGGLLAGLYALEAIRACADEGTRSHATAWLPDGSVTFVVNPDEEIGSPVSTPVIRDVAAAADVALVMESARANGDIVSARKGMTHLRATLVGRAAHAGVEPHKGRSAVLEAAHKTVALHALNGRWEGVTVNVGAVDGGTRPNIVAERAVMAIDLRARTMAEQQEAEAAIGAILASATVPDVTATVEVLAGSRPMERTDASARLVDQAKGIAALLGFELADAATGGASDANTTAGLGVPTLDGLGPIGGDDHSPSEYVELASIVPRTTLLAALILAAGRA